MKVALMDYHQDCVDPLFKELGSIKRNLLNYHDFVVVKVRTSHSGRITKLVCAVIVSSNLYARLGTTRLKSVFKEQFPNVQIKYDITFKTFYLRGIDAFEVSRILRLLDARS